MPQSVECPTSAQVRISWFVGLSSTLGSVLTAQSLELLWILCFSLSAPPMLTLCLCFCVCVSLSVYLNVLFHV